MGIPEMIFDEEAAVEEARNGAGQAREADLAADPAGAPSCSAALAARAIDEQVAPI